jgi:hypothetical protein
MDRDRVWKGEMGGMETEEEGEGERSTAVQLRHSCWRLRNEVDGDGDGWISWRLTE